MTKVVPTSALAPADEEAIHQALLTRAEQSDRVANRRAPSTAMTAIHRLHLADIVVLGDRLRRSTRIRGAIVTRAASLVANLDAAGTPVWQDGQAERGEALIDLAAVEPGTRANAFRSMRTRLRLTDLHVRLLTAHDERSEAWLAPLVARLRDLELAERHNGGSVEGRLATRVELKLGHEATLVVWLTELARTRVRPAVTTDAVHRAELTLRPAGHQFPITARHASALVSHARAELARRTAA